MGGNISTPNLKELQVLYSDVKQNFPQGLASKGELVQYYKKASSVVRDPNWNNIKENFFDHCDVNEDGKADLREYMTMVATGSDGTREEKLRFAFQLFDQDKNGYITETELRSVLTALYKSKHTSEASKKAAENARAMVAGMDADKDGKISEWEFMQYAEAEGLIAN